MVREKFREKPIYYKLLSSLLRVSSGIVITMVVIFAIRFLLETPLYRMFDGIMVAEIVKMALVLVAIICFITAWFKSIGGGIAALVPVIAYTVVDSIQNAAYTASAMNYIMFMIAILFIVQGMMKKHIETDRLKDIMGPTVDKRDGPDLSNLHL